VKAFKKSIFALLVGACVLISACGAPGAAQNETSTELVLSDDGKEIIRQYKDDERVIAFQEAKDILQKLPSMKEEEWDQAEQDLLSLTDKFKTPSIADDAAQSVNNIFFDAQQNGKLSQDKIGQAYYQFCYLLDEIYGENFVSSYPLQIDIDAFNDAMLNYLGCTCEEEDHAEDMTFIFKLGDDEFTKTKYTKHGELLYVDLNFELIPTIPDSSESGFNDLSEEEKADKYASYDYEQLQMIYPPDVYNDQRMQLVLNRDEFTGLFNALRGLSQEEIKDMYMGSTDNKSSGIFTYQLQVGDKCVGCSFFMGQVKITAIEDSEGIYKEKRSILPLNEVTEKKSEDFQSLDDFEDYMHETVSWWYFKKCDLNEEASFSWDEYDEAAAEDSMVPEAVPDESSIENSDVVNEGDGESYSPTISTDWYKTSDSFYDEMTGITLSISWDDNGNFMLTFDGQGAYSFNSADMQDLGGGMVRYDDPSTGAYIYFDVSRQSITVGDDGMYGGEYVRQF